MNKTLKLILSILILPLILLIETVKSPRSVGGKILLFILVLIIFGWVWFDAYNQARAQIMLSLFQTGVTDKITKVKISGTSMLPTIQDGSEVTLSSPNKFGLTRGDIVSFNNNETAGLFYIKRIIGLPGEQITIKNGYYYINGKALDEDYTLDHLPTFGNTFLSDCENQTIPANHYFVSGDNRTVSQDSRVIGFVDKDDIEGVIKTKIGEKFVSDQKQASISAIQIDPAVFQKKLNDLRTNQKVQPLVFNEELNGLAKKRADQIKDNFSDWKNKTIPVEKLLETNGYRYNMIHEYVTFGFLNEQNILDQMQESANEKNQLLSTNYLEAGVGVTNVTVGECTYPVISVIFSWPAVPTYDKAVLDSWSKEITITNQSLSNLQTWVGYQGVDQQKLKQLINLTAQMQQISTRIYNKEKNREWLTPQDYQDISNYENLIKQSNQLSDEVFGKKTDVKGIATPSQNIRRF